MADSNDTSQYNEGAFVLEHFRGRTGRFLDIGAFDGKTFSNTWPLAEAGWSGVCVEPNPPAFCHLMRTYEGNPKVMLVNAAVSAFATQGHRLSRFEANTADGYSADMVSSLLPEHTRKFAGYPFREIFIPILWPEEMVWTLQGSHFAFINIDVEGANIEVLDAVLKVFSAEMVCVEIDPESKLGMFVGILAGNGYHNSIRMGGNLLAWRSI